MPFIKTRRLQFNDQGEIIKGSASLIDTVYVSGKKYHSRQVVRECLGKVLWLDDGHRSGIFCSPERGIFGYDALKDEYSKVSKTDVRISHFNVANAPRWNKELDFGNIYAFLEFLSKKKLLSVIHKSCCSCDGNVDYGKLLVHTCYTTLKNSERITCDRFVRDSWLSCLVANVANSTLRSDTPFFYSMSDSNFKLAFFRNFVDWCKKEYPNFGNCCYVDSTPLPNDIKDNPFNALCSHGLSGCSIQMRLILILDEATGLPVWYTIIPGNVVDIKTLSDIRDEVGNLLHLRISSFVLDAGYVSKENLDAFADAEKFGNILARMPARNGYPYMELYQKHKDKIYKTEYEFHREGHAYFGYKQDVTLFGHHFYAYIYVDKPNALIGHTKDYEKHPDKYEDLSPEERDFHAVKFGYFVLISNKSGTPKETLDNYFGRMAIEGFFKTGKEYLQLLPMRKWSDKTVRGKIMADIIASITYIEFRHALNGVCSVSDFIVDSRTLQCYCTDNDEQVHVTFLSKNAREALELLEISINYNRSLRWYRERYLLL